MCLTDDMLKEAGVNNGMHRMMLLNRRNELLLATPPGSPRIQASPSLAQARTSLGSGLVVRPQQPTERNRQQHTTAGGPLACQQCPGCQQHW